MSIKKPQLLFYIFLLVGLVVYKVVDKSALEKSETKKRAFSSIHVSQFSSHGVVDRVIELNLQTEQVSDKQTKVTAHMKLPFPVEQTLNYKWILGSGVVLSSGTLTGAIAQPPANQDFTQAITVEGYTPSELRHIKFEVIGEKGPRRLFAEGLISSQAEKSFEKFVQKTESENNVEKHNFKKQIHRKTSNTGTQHR